MVLLAGIQFFHLLVEGAEAGYSISLILHLLICWKGIEYVFIDWHIQKKGFPGGTSGKEPICQCRRLKRHRFDPWVGERHGNPLQYSCLETPMDREAWRAIVVRWVLKSGAWQMPLSTHTNLEKKIRYIKHLALFLVHNRCSIISSFLLLLNTPGAFTPARNPNNAQIRAEAKHWVCKLAGRDSFYGEKKNCSISNVKVGWSRSVNGMEKAIIQDRLEGYQWREFISSY